MRQKAYFEREELGLPKAALSEQFLDVEQTGEIYVG